MKPLALYVAALGIVATLFVMSAMLSPMVSNPLHYGIISKKTHLLNSNAIFRGLIQRWRALPSSAGPPSVHGTLRFYRSMLNDQAITLKYSSCALVSSSGILQGKGAGQEIDRHACVIRMNLAPVKGHRRDVGTRTTVRVMNFLSAPVAVRVPMPDGAIFVWGLYLDNRTDYYRRKVLEVSKKYGHRTQIVSLTPDGEKHAESLFYFETGRSFDATKSRPSTGWYTMLVALDICEKIHVYGMVPADYCSIHPNSTVRYHYFEKFSEDECTVYRENQRVTGRPTHRFLSEKAIYARWALRYNILFHYPKWKLSQREQKET